MKNSGSGWRTPATLGGPHFQWMHSIVDIEHAVDRHDAAIIEEATTIAQLRCQIALIIEAFEKLDLCALQGLENHAQGEAARDRYREILQQLNASYAAKK
jgi:hypothetical protein